MKIGVNSFVLRQTASSKFGYFLGTWEQLAKDVEHQFPEARKGYRDGVLLVPMNPMHFMSSVVPVTEDVKLKTTFESRRQGEAPYLQTVGFGMKTPAKKVDVVIYRRDVLGKDATTDCEWEIVSINCYALSITGDLMTPVARARNILNMEGGTSVPLDAMSKGELIDLVNTMAREVIFWATHVQLEERKEEK